LYALLPAIKPIALITNGSPFAPVGPVGIPNVITPVVGLNDALAGLPAVNVEAPAVIFNI